jgi:hypothetical protein
MLNIGPLYVTGLKYPHRKPLPVVEKGWTHEIDDPFRRGSCLVFRLPFTKPAIVIGWWQEAQAEEDALTAAIWGRKLDVSVDELLEWD